MCKHADAVSSLVSSLVLPYREGVLTIPVEKMVSQLHFDSSTIEEFMPAEAGAALAATEFVAFCEPLLLSNISVVLRGYFVAQTMEPLL